MGQPDTAPIDDDQLPSAERLKAFTDAVVAIAMTLLILPLMDSVGELAASGATVWQWIAEEQGSLVTFALSFLLIATFWLGHHRLFSRVHRVNGGLLWLMILWMFTIVWMPVATGIVGSFPYDDPQKVIYIGSLFVTSIVGLLTRLYLRGHPRLHEIRPSDFAAGLTADISTSTLFLAAMVLSFLVPALGYWVMTVLFLSTPLERVLRRVFPRLREESP